ncbi:MAG: glycosyltransferase family 2 protein [Acidobacteriota bacterium]
MPRPAAEQAAGPARRSPGEPFSVVVPVYNEERLVGDSITAMMHALEALGGDFEMLVCENGSTDETARLVDRLSQQDPRIRLERLPEPDYGGAMRHGIQACTHDRVVIFNVDFWSGEFVREALTHLGDSDMVVGSKVADGSADERPWFRRVITRAFNGVLRLAFGFRGTDTHGMKAFRRRALVGPLAQCVTSRSIFDTELVLRAERAGLRIVEIPVAVREIRQPSYWAVARRLPEVTWNMWKLSRALRKAR